MTGHRACLPMIAHAQVSIRSYGPESGPDRHDFAQLVLPLGGRLEIDVDGRQQRLSPDLAAFVPAGTAHSQAGDPREGNRSLVLDLPTTLLSASLHAQLGERAFLALTPAASHLVAYMGGLQARRAADVESLLLWVPVLLDRLACSPTRPQARLDVLRALVEASPGADWRTARMAAQAGLGATRLHELFLRELGTTPHAWLLALRVRHACAALRGSDTPIADIALRFGFADQSALTHAVRRATGLTPGGVRTTAGLAHFV